jgi:hypothetical protein
LLTPSGETLSSGRLTALKPKVTNANELVARPVVRDWQVRPIQGAGSKVSVVGPLGPAHPGAAGWFCAGHGTR